MEFVGHCATVWLPKGCDELLEVRARDLMENMLLKQGFTLDEFRWEETTKGNERLLTVWGDDKD